MRPPHDLYSGGVCARRRVRFWRSLGVNGTGLAFHAGMIVDFAANTAPALWSLMAALGFLVLLILAGVDPELTEVYLGDGQILVATAALAAIVIVLLVPHP